MNVTVSVWSRFHAFYLARELFKHRQLARLISTYPKFEAKKYGVDEKTFYSVLWAEVLNRLLRNLPAPVLRGMHFPFSLVDLYDRRVARLIPANTDIFVGWSAVAEHSLRRARALGALTVLERGSTHIDTAEELMIEEYDRLGIKKTEAIDPSFKEKERREYGATDFIGIPSSHVEKSFVDRGFPKEKLIRTPYGVDLEHFSPGVKTDDTFRVLHCGTLSVRKGIVYLLKAFTELALPNSELWLIGPIADEAKPILAQYAASNIKVTGPFKEFDLHRYYTQCSVYCLMSIEEGMAMTLLQAMACGLPAIVTDFTGGQDIIREGVDGFVVQRRDVVSLKEKLSLLYENREQAKAMGRSSADRIAQNFTWAHYGERIIAGYSAALATKGFARTRPL